MKMTEEQLAVYQQASKDIWEQSTSLEELKANMVAFEKAFLSEVENNES